MNLYTYIAVTFCALSIFAESDDVPIAHLAERFRNALESEQQKILHARMHAIEADTYKDRIKTFLEKNLSTWGISSKLAPLKEHSGTLALLLAATTGISLWHIKKLRHAVYHNEQDKQDLTKDYEQKFVTFKEDIVSKIESAVTQEVDRKTSLIKDQLKNKQKKIVELNKELETATTAQEYLKIDNQTLAQLVEDLALKNEGLQKELKNNTNDLNKKDEAINQLKNTLTQKNTQLKNLGDRIKNQDASA